MSYRVVILPSAIRELGSLPNRIQQQIDARIMALADKPRPPGMKSLKGQHKGLCRVRSGAYRIVYQVQDSQRIVSVVKIADRKDVYD